MLATRSDDALYQAYLHEGCHASFEELVSRHYERVRTFFLNKTGDAARAEDLTQQVFCRLISSRDTYDRTRPFLAWFHTIAANACKNEFRSRHRRRVFSEADFKLRDETRTGVLDTAVASTTPEEEYESRVLNEKLADSVEQLTPEYRRIFELRYLNGYSVAEVAEITGMPHGSVKAKGTRARARVLTLMAPYLEE